MNHNPLVSIIVVSHNSMQHIDDCIASILTQSYKNFEVLFWDNCSSDGSYEYVQSRYPGILYIKSDQNLGYANAIFAALKKVKGDFIAPLNIDTEVHRDWLKLMVEFMIANDSIGAVTPSVLLYNQRRYINTQGLNLNITGLAFCRNIFKLYKDNLLPHKVSGLSGCSYLIKREIMYEIGRANKSWDMYYDDVVLSWLINLMGFEIWCVPQAKVYHKYIMKMSAEKYFSLEYNRLKLILAVFNVSTLVVLSPLFVVFEIITLIYCLLYGLQYSSAWLRVRRMVMENKKEITEMRILYRNLRKLSDLQLIKRLKFSFDWTQLAGILF